jgi:hypothetical protein
VIIADRVSQGLLLKELGRCEKKRNHAASLPFSVDFPIFDYPSDP